MSTMRNLLTRARASRAAHLVVVVLRIVLGFAFLPAGLKKVLGQPFTDPDKHGAFHDFLHAFHATGGFYRFVGAMQLAAAALLMTQLRATLGALVALPILTAIVALCWSTGAVPTAIVATMMWLGMVALLAWDDAVARLLGGTPGRDPSARTARGAPAGVTPPVAPHDGATPSDDVPLVDLHLWARCGLAIFVGYLAITALTGEIYRPRRVELREPAFYVLVALPLAPLATWLLERRRRRAGATVGAR